MRHPKDTQKMTQKTNCSQNIIFHRAPSGGDILGTVFTQSEKVKWCNCPFLRSKSNYDYTHVQCSGPMNKSWWCNAPGAWMGCFNSVIQVLTWLSAVKHQPQGLGHPKWKILRKTRALYFYRFHKNLLTPSHWGKVGANLVNRSTRWQRNIEQHCTMDKLLKLRNCPI